MTDKPPPFLMPSDSEDERWFRNVISELREIVAGVIRGETVGTATVDFYLEMIEFGVAEVFFGKPGADSFEPLDLNKGPLVIDMSMSPGEAAMRIAEEGGFFRGTA